MFPCLPTSRNIVAETKFASQETKMFPNKFRNFVAETTFPSLPTCFQMFPTQETLVSRSDMFKQCLKTIVQKNTYELMFLKKCFLVCPRWKHDEASTGNNVSATMFPSLPRG